MKFGFEAKSNAPSDNTLTIKDKKFKINSAVFGATIGYYEHWMNLSDPHTKTIPGTSRASQKRDCDDWKNLRWTLGIKSEFVDREDKLDANDPYPEATLEEKFQLSLTDPVYQSYLASSGEQDRDLAYSWEPIVSSEDIILDKMPAPADLLGATLKVPGYDKARESYLFTMCVFEHAALEKNNIEFIERDGDNFRIRWKAKCAVEWNEEYGENLDFTMDCWLKYCGILVIADSREQADKLVAARLDLSKLPVVEKSRGWGNRLRWHIDTSWLPLLDLERF